MTMGAMEDDALVGGAIVVVLDVATVVVASLAATVGSVPWSPEHATSTAWANIPFIMGQPHSHP